MVHAFRNLSGLLLLCIVTICLLASCACRQTDEKKREAYSTYQTEDLIKHQKDIVRDESGDIDSYIARNNYSMTTTPTGLRFTIYRNGEGTKPVVDNTVVEIKYNVSKLDGTEVYSSESLGKMQIKVGKSEVASGLQEGLKYMKTGDKAIFILPSHLAYGLTGDGDKIKRYQVLVIDVELLAILDDR